MNNPPTQMLVEIVSDIVCPWCFIGKRRLDQALALWRLGYPTADVAVRWKPYFLNPDTPPDGEPYRAFLEQKFGGPEAVEALWERVRGAGASTDVQFAFARIQTRPNTLNAHRLLRRAQSGKKPVSASDWAERLFVGHFQRGEDIGDPGVLTEIGRELGEDADALRLYLASDADRDAVRAEALAAQQMGVQGVPFYIFNQRLATSGAQPATTLFSAMQEAAGT